MGRLSTGWMVEALCRDEPRDLWFSDDRLERRKAVAICGVCPVRRECGEYAATLTTVYGIWAGVRKSETHSRQQISRACPWCGLVAGARALQLHVQQTHPSEEHVYEPATERDRSLCVWCGRRPVSAAHTPSCGPHRFVARSRAVRARPRCGICRQLPWHTIHMEAQ